MKGIVTNVDTGEEVDINLDKLIEEKVLVQATNGGGKSYLIRKFSESATKAGIPQTIIQKEPEFNSLRDTFDYIIVGDKTDGADIQMSLKIPELLAQKMLELPTISFILDLSTLIVSERKEFLRRFLDVINSATKKFWHDRFFIIDEAHIFAPEKGKGTSEALRSIEELASQGRKKGFSLICCTQRPSKLSKDVTGELSCKFIGKAIDAEDRKRNAEELGMSTKPIDTLHFKKMGRPNFHFYAVGSGISDEPILVKTNECETKHEIERGYNKPIPTSSQLKDILGTLEDLPEEAKAEKETIDSLKAELRKKEVELQKIIETVKSESELIPVPKKQPDFNKSTSRLEIKQDEYLDCIRSRETLIKIAIDLSALNKSQGIRATLKGKKKPTITHWKARGAESVAKWILEKYPELIRIGMNPNLYGGLSTKIYSK